MPRCPAWSDAPPDVVVNAEAAAALQASVSLPALAGTCRKPLAVSVDKSQATLRDELSLAKFIDRAVVNGAASATTTLAIVNPPELSGEVLSLAWGHSGRHGLAFNWFTAILGSMPTACRRPAKPLNTS